jgi:hypothetical protein
MKNVIVCYNSIWSHKVGLTFEKREKNVSAGSERESVRVGERKGERVGEKVKEKEEEARA